MGIGDFGNGQVVLYLSLRYDATPNDIAAWKLSFDRASQMLFNATNGDAQFSKIVISNNSAGADEADAWLLNVGGASLYGHILYNAGAFGTNAHFDLAVDAATSPYTILHEFGHYAFGLGDEYGIDTTNTPFHCTGTDQAQACIMGPKIVLLSTGSSNVDRIVGGAVQKGSIVEFCSTNHVDNIDSTHHAQHGGKSCAEVIQGLHSIQVASGMNTNAVEVPQVPICWVLTDPISSVAVVVDGAVVGAVAGGTVGAGQIESLMEFVNDWKQSAAALEDRVTLVPVGVEPPGDGPPALPSIDAGIEVARDAIKRTGRRSATQVIVLFSTGRNRVSQPVERGDELARDGIRVLAVGLGPDGAALQQIAEHSQGAYYEVDPRRGFDAVRDHVMNLASELRAGAPILKVSSDSLPDDEQDVRVKVEEGSKAVTFFLNHTPGVDLSLSVTSPGGAEVLPQDDHLTSLDGGYRTLSVKEPEAGDWVVRVEPPVADDSYQFTLTAHSENPNLHVGVRGARGPYQRGDTVTLQVVVNSPFPVVGLTNPVARVISPGGENKKHPLKPKRGRAYLVSFEVDEVGAYDVEIDVRNEGGAVPARPPPPDADPLTLEIPEFQRVKRFQVHVSDAPE